jgi:virginiamycin B lyase
MPLGQNTALRKFRRLPVVDRLEDRRLLSGSVIGIPLGPPLVTPTPGPIPTQSASSLVAGPDGNIWFTDQDNNAIGRETATGVVTEFPIPTDEASPDQITAGADGNLWFIETDLNQIAKITTAGTVTEFPMPTADASPSALAAGPGGDIWFVDSGNNEVGKITPAGAVTEFSFDQTNLTLAGGLVDGADGNIYAAAQDDSGNGLLSRVTPAGKISSIALPDYPTDLTVGPDKNLWVDCSGQIDRVTTSGQVTSFAVPTQDGTFGITTGPDGAMWFGTYGENPMGRITTDGSIVEFSPPGLGQYGFVNAIAAGPEQKIWYASDSGTPASFDPHNAILAGGVDATAAAGTTSTVTVASFVDLAPGATAGNYSAMIDWGDGTSSVGTIAANSQGGFDVSGSHTWSIGSSNVTITITDVRASAALGGRTATAFATVTSPAPPTQGTGVNISATAGQLFTGVVAHYTGVILSSLSSYSANIDWGDGHFTSGTITPDGQGGVAISGSNRYAASGSYTITTNLWPWSFGNIIPIVGMGGGIAGRGRLVVPPNTAIPMSNPTIASGGSGASTSIVPAPPLPEPPVPLPNPDGTTSTANVAKGVMDGSGYSLLASSSTPFSGVVASFKLTDPGADLSQFHATVKWTDPGTFDWFTLPEPDITNAPIAPDGQGGFTVSVNNVNLAQFGWYHYQVLISDDRLASGDASIVGSAYGQVVIDTPIRPLPLGASGGTIADDAGAVKIPTGTGSTPNPVLSEHVKFSAVPIRQGAGHAFAGVIGMLSGFASGTNTSNLSGTINWGDGTSTAAQFVRDRAGNFHVKGKHTFTAPGDTTVTLSLTQSIAGANPQTDPPVSLPLEQTRAHVSGRAKPPKFTATPAGAIAAIAGQKFTAELGTLSGPVASGQSLVGAIHWGDGTNSPAQLVETPSGLWEASASHTYTHKGMHLVHVIVSLVGSKRSVIARFGLHASVSPY